jgi:hypothetical protein
VSTHQTNNHSPRRNLVWNDHAKQRYKVFTPAFPKLRYTLIHFLLRIPLIIKSKLAVYYIELGHENDANVKGEKKETMKTRE